MGDAPPGQTGPDFAAVQDAADPLRGFRKRFYVPPGVIYLDGNSLGLASRDAEAAILQALADWKAHAVEGWTAGDRPWFYLGEALGALQAGLVGADPAEVVVTGTTTVNLHTLAATFYQPRGRRTRILTEALAFPSDLYALQSLLRLRGYDPAAHLVLVPSRDGHTVEEEDLIAAMTDEVALVLLPGVLYRSGQLLDMARLAAAARDRGIPIGLDLCHSAGAVPHRLHDWGVDFAFWCNYKYLNAGPGAVASLYVHQRHFGTRPGLGGWFGSRKERQFDMLPDLDPAPSAGAWQISTPPVLSAAALYGTLQLFAAAGMDRVRAKSLALTEYLIHLVHAELAVPHGVRVVTPAADARRGGHVALEHPEAARLARALRARGIIPDFRPPNVLRLAPAALYTSFAEVWAAVQALREILERREYEGFPPGRDVVA